MKITTDLPASISINDRNKISSIITGVINGWSYLPYRIQELVEWVGIKPVSELEMGNIAITIKFEKRNGGYEEIFFINDNTPDKIRELVPQKFREKVLTMLNNSIAKLKAQTEEYERLIG